ncbi:SPW repeat protein [Nocardiopsis sp. CT-R113]|uniref:SPW repeat protein n=1 Tax=Nocardiopsis codii TaxID=3065942 RepID=A0ABU7K8Q1_9ACTN|nr:SPW repeat protein [Nocardiopsis sp. CT-R113]MEE2038626.1 SPW repeat protein [Nocardiopsis sp. CT-R113]
MREKGRWADWVAVAAGLALGVSWIWHGMYGFSGGAMFVLGLGVIVGSAFSLTRPGALSSELGVLAIGVLVFVMPWLLGFTHLPAAAWTAWIIGGGIALLGAFNLTQADRARRRDPDLAWSAHVNEIPS